MATINLGDLNVTTARKVAKAAGLKGLGKKGLETIIPKLEELDDAALMSAYAEALPQTTPEPEPDANTGAEDTQSEPGEHETTLIAVFPTCPKCGAEVPTPGEDGLTVCSCNQELIVGTHSSCGTDICCIGEPADDAVCPKCSQPLFDQIEEDAEITDTDTPISLGLVDGKIVYSDTKNGIVGNPDFETVKHVAESGDNKGYLTAEQFGMELQCQNPDCANQRKDYGVSAQWLLDQLEKALKNEHFRPISPWHPGHADCREAMLGTDIPCPLGCGNMLHTREAGEIQKGKLAICGPCSSAIKELKIDTKSTLSNAPVRLPAWSYLAADFYDHPLLTHEEREAAKKAGEEFSFDGPGELSPEAIETVRNLIDGQGSQNELSAVKCPRCNKHKLKVWQAEKLAEGQRVVCDKCAEELQGPKEPVECGHDGCKKTVLLSPLQRYLIGDSVRCNDHKDDNVKTEEPETVVASEPEPAVPETPKPVVASEPEPVATEPEPASTPAPVQSTPTPVVAMQPMAAPLPASGSEIASAILAMAEVLKAMPQQDMAEIMKAIPAQQDLAGILSAVVQPQPDVAALIQASKESSGTEVALVGQLGTIISDMLRDRAGQPRTPEEFAQAAAAVARASIYGDLNGGDQPSGAVSLRDPHDARRS